MGGKKSSVCTSANSSLTRYTAASSLLSNPTSRFGSDFTCMPSSSWASTPAPTFAPQPAHLASFVSFTSFSMVSS